MKSFYIKVVSIAAALMVLFTALFALPVSAASDVRNSGTELWDFGGGWWDFFLGWFDDERGNGTWEELYQSMPSTQLANEKAYYTATSVQPISNTGSSGSGGSSGGRGSTSTAYQSGQTVTTPIVSSSYNTNTNNYNYSLNIPTTTYNSTTNNYYEQYDITNIYRTTN